MNRDGQAPEPEPPYRHEHQRVVRTARYKLIRTDAYTGPALGEGR